MTGYLSDAQAAAVVLGASALAYPSLYEGFGLPPLEAMALGVPVVVSDIPTLREVCGSAGLSVHPEDTRGWASRLAELVEEGHERDQLKKWGRLRSQDFSWQHTARQHHDLLSRMAA